LSAHKIKAPRGTFDVLGEQSEARAALESRARALLEGAGYERIETPTFEATELFELGVGESTDIVRKEMFTFEDGAGRSLTLRPEGTAPVCRAYVEHGMHKRRQPVKLWYLSSFFRHERAQAGRYRQFWQVGAEALGSEDPAVDAESITLLATLLAQLGVSGARLRLSSLGSQESRGEYRELLQSYLREHSGELSEDVRERIDLNPLRAFDSEHPGTRGVMAGAPRLLEHIGADDAEHFGEVQALLSESGVAYEVDPTLVRGLDYYTRTVFEFTSDALGAQSGVAGGGRYDGLVQRLGGPATPGMGWAAGVERILLAGDAVSAPSGALELFVALADGEAGRAPARGVCAARRGALGRAARADGARAALAQGSTRLRGRPRGPLRRDRRGLRDGAAGYAGGRSGAGAHRHRGALGVARPAHLVAARGACDGAGEVSKALCAVQLFALSCRRR
jgi:histidyl-tRNA synthetase